MAKQIKKKVDQIKAKLTHDNFPSLITEDYWVYASVKKEQNHPRKYKNINSGKWVVFADITEIDTIWQKINKATENGQLGLASKVATAKHNPNATSKNEKVICVYTYNWQDLNDINRVEKALRSIGIKQTLFYKTDSDTREGKYKVNGSTGISKYVSKGTRNYKKHELSSLPGVKEEKIKALNKIGIKNFDDLISFDTSPKMERVGVSCEFITKLKLLALSQIEKKIFKLTPIQIPKENILHFDIETDLNTPETIRRVWSIAVHHKETIVHFYAENFKQEQKILKAFVSYLKKNKDAHMFSYSGFDVRVLKHALTRHKLDVDFFSNLHHYDLCELIKQNYVLPVNGYGVKEVGDFFGYKYKSVIFSGLFAARTYMRLEGTKEKLPKDIYHYIQDDVRVMDHIIKQLHIRKDIKDIFDHQTK